MMTHQPLGVQSSPKQRLEDLSDGDLVTAINGGDPVAFEVLYYRYRDWVVGLAFRLTGDNDAALDVLQETFLYVLKKFPGFRLTAQFRTFLYPAVRNLSIGARRKAARYQASPSELDTLEQAPAPVAAAGHGDLNVVVAALPAEQREVLLLRFVDGLALGEIALAMDIPLGTVKSRLHNALAFLRQDPRTKDLFAQ